MALIMVCSHQKICSTLLAINILESFMGHSHNGWLLGNESSTLSFSAVGMKNKCLVSLAWALLQAPT